jgi:hypothetical protein
LNHALKTLFQFERLLQMFPVFSPDNLGAPMDPGALPKLMMNAVALFALNNIDA